MNVRFVVVSLLALAACGGDPMDPGTLGSGNQSRDCSTATPLTLSVGEVHALVGADRSTLCVGSGDYTLIPVNSGAAASSKVALTFTSGNTTGISGVLASRAPSTAADASTLFGGARFTRNAAFDLNLRARERQLFASRATGARTELDASRRSASGARLSIAAAAPAIGDLISINANSKTDCSSPTLRTGRVVAITQRAVVVADTGNPTGGFTTSDYQSIGVEFDTLAFTVDTLNFGAPVDVDNNGGREVLFFTKTVNDLTPTNSQSYVGGFFFSRDLYPKTGSGSCAASNFAEMFYLLVPDPTRAGSNLSSPFTKANVRDLTVSVLAHEFQHLINASRRLYVTRTSTDEEVWLNEGLSHVAEELSFYRSSGLAPKQNLTIGALRGGGNVAIDAFNEFESSNFGRLMEYLPDPDINSPYADDDSLATRGATWELLRYATDRKGGTERDTWYSLVNSATSGLTNLSNVYGSSAFGGNRPWVRDWAVANFTDDAGITVASAYQHPSWNFRDLIPQLRPSVGYPLKTLPLTAGTAQTVSLVGGGASYLRFHVASGVVGAVSIAAGTSAVPTSVEMMLVRTR